METSYDFVKSQELYKAPREAFKTSQHLGLLLLAKKNRSTTNFGGHRSVSLQIGPQFRVDSVSIWCCNECKKVRERRHVPPKLFVVSVQRGIAQISDFVQLFAPKHRSHLKSGFPGQFKASSFVISEGFTFMAHKRKLTAAEFHITLREFVERNVRAFHAKLVRPHLKFKKIVVPILLSFIDNARLHDGERSSSERQYTRKERLEVIKDIAPAIASALPVNNPRLAKEDGWQDCRAKNDASQNPKLCYVITRHRVSPNVTTRLNNMHFLGSAGSPVGALAA